MTDTDEDSKYAEILKSMENIRKNLAEAQSALARQSKRQKDQNNSKVAAINHKSYRVSKANSPMNNFTSKKSSDEMIASPEQGKNQFITVSSKNALQLINRNVAEKQLEERIRMQKYLILKKEILRKEIELKQFKQYLNKNREKYDYCDWVNIYGDGSEASKLGYGLYAVIHLGNKLVPLSQDPRSNDLENKICFNHKTFIRHPRGILVNTEVNSLVQEYCHFYTSRGICPRRNCTYKHSNDHLALCKSFLYGQCPFTEKTCNLSHIITEKNVPTCLFFVKGYCKNGRDCRFSHVRTNKNAKICRPFAIGGWCDRGLSCTYKHIYDCPDFVDYGSCRHGKNCNLAHPKKKMSTETSETITEITGSPEKSNCQRKSEKEPEEFSRNHGEKIVHISKIFDTVAAIRVNPKDSQRTINENRDDVVHDKEEFENFVKINEKRRENDGNIEMEEGNEDIDMIQRELIENQDFIAF